MDFNANPYDTPSCLLCDSGTGHPLCDACFAREYGPVVELARCECGAVVAWEGDTCDECSLAEERAARREAA